MSKVVAALKQIQSDSIVFYMKLHNLHWNVKGLLFKPIHESTEEIYENFADVFDSVAERVLQLGDKPYVTLSDVLKNAKIKEESSTKFSGEEVLNIILSDFEYFMDSFKKLSDEAEKVGDTTTTDYANGILAQLEKNIWMLKAQLS
ncbi:DNA starvation/stationary phase protection protein [Helicobacter sp. MIT 14-3879]|uniref:Dps family protein n=1 Tax=Helicobacter sp. MIT 14-3879 TaxID=2040649 RepID=UPI000E1F4D44|nr:DNA starvation/stationary phase protection protein [Helicobacter sp. MIT 14-3879]RDU64816.1 DNA starvation/stationary phase protection protein [Helicobacter sp. MIT 14-3879]